MNMNAARAPGVGLLALFLALPLAAVGQQPAAKGTEGSRTADLARADALRKEAIELYTTGPDNWSKVVRLHIEAAKAAPADDPERVQDLWMAGSVSEAIGELRNAQRHLEAAAELATELEDYYRAGEGYLAAAILAARQGRTRQAERLLDRAEIAADPELLDPELCDCLKQRIAMLRGRGF